MKGSVAFTAVMCCLTFPVTASAATLVREPEGQLVYRAAAGEVNDFFARETFEGEYPWDRTLGISEALADVTVGNGCTTEPQLACELSSTDVLLGNRDDHARVLIDAFRTSRVWGEEGDDTVYAGGGEARAYGGPGDDVVGAGADGTAVGEGGPGDDNLTLFQGAFTILRGDAGADTLSGGGFTTRAFGGDGPDALELSGGGNADGGRGSDRIDVHGGSSFRHWRVDGGPGDDTITVTGSANSVTCGPGTDTVTASTDNVIASDCENVNVEGAA